MMVLQWSPLFTSLSPTMISLIMPNTVNIPRPNLDKLDDIELFFVLPVVNMLIDAEDLQHFSPIPRQAG